MQKETYQGDTFKDNILGKRIPKSAAFLNLSAAILLARQASTNSRNRE